MQSLAWIALLRIVPPALSDKLMVVTSNGNELNIASVCRFEQDFMVVRARLAGTTDEASIVFLPYDTIDYMGFRVPMKEPELEEMFATDAWQPPPPAAMATAPMPMVAAPTMAMPRPAAPMAPLRPAPAPTPTPTAPAPAAAPPPPAPVAAVPPPPPPPPAPAAAPAGGNSGILPGKAALLERLRRSRLNQEGPKSSEAK